MGPGVAHAQEIFLSSQSEGSACLFCYPQVLVLHGTTTPPLPPMPLVLPPISLPAGPWVILGSPTNRALPCLPNQLLIKRAFN